MLPTAYTLIKAKHIVKMRRKQMRFDFCSWILPRSITEGVSSEGCASALFDNMLAWNKEYERRRPMSDLSLHQPSKMYPHKIEPNNFCRIWREADVL